MTDWRPVAGLKSAYEVSGGGFVRHVGSGRMVPRLLNKNGYWFCRLAVDGSTITVLVHRVVAAAFIANPHGLAVVNHIDGNKLNPEAENLEWVTPRGNVIHAIATGLRIRRNNPKRVVPFSARATPEIAGRINALIARMQIKLPGYKLHHMLEDGAHLLSGGDYVPDPRPEFGQKVWVPPWS